METRRPGSPNVLGILSIVFGAVVVGLTLIGLAVSDSALASMGADAGRAMQAYMAELQPWATIISIVMIAMSAALIFIGIGQRGYRRWARTGAITWSIVGLLVLAGQVAFHFLVTAPALDRMVHALAGSLGSSMSSLSAGAGITTLLLYAPYPIILIIMMQRPAVVEAMNN